MVCGGEVGGCELAQIFNFLGLFYCGKLRETEVQAGRVEFGCGGWGWEAMLDRTATNSLPITLQTANHTRVSLTNDSLAAMWQPANQVVASQSHKSSRG